MSALDDIIARDSAPQQSSALDAIIARDSAAPTQQEPQQPTTETKSSSLWDELSRQTGLTIRAGINGVTALPAIVGDALNSGTNAIFGTHLQPVSSSIKDLENRAGIPQPKNATERVVQDIASSMASVNPTVKAGSLLSKASSPVVSAVGNGLKAMPGMQVSGAAGAGAGSGIARENGFGPGGQIIGSFVGGGLGAVAPSAAIATARGISAIPENIKDAAQPFTNPEKYVGSQLAAALREDAPTVAENIRNAEQYVPGSLPTTAQVGQTPLLVATEKNLANTAPYKVDFANRETANNAARWDLLNYIAKSPEELAAAQAQRTAVTSPLYEQAHANIAPIDDAFTQFSQRPAVQQAMKQADILAKNEGVNLKWPTSEDPTISGQALDYTNRALSDLIDSAARTGSNQEVRALTGSQNLLKDWMEQSIPDVAKASQTYAKLSVPVNTMEAAQQIAEKLGTRAMAPDGNPQIQLTPYKSALVSALKGQKYGIDPQAEQALNAIQKDLQRSTISNSLKSPGSDTAYNLSAKGWLAKQLYGDDFSGSSPAARGIGALGATVAGHPMVGMGILAGGKKFGTVAADKLNQKLAEMLLNPNMLLPYLDEASPNATKNILENVVRSNVNQGLLGATVSPKSNQ